MPRLAGPWGQPKRENGACAIYEEQRLLKRGREKAPIKKVLTHNKTTRQEIMSPRILFVEDDDNVRGLLLTAVAGTYEAEGVATAQAAIVRASQTAFDIAVVDVMLP